MLKSGVLLPVQHILYGYDYNVSQVINNPADLIVLRGNDVCQVVNIVTIIYKEA